MLINIVAFSIMSLCINETIVDLYDIFVNKNCVISTDLSQDYFRADIRRDLWVINGRRVDKITTIAFSWNPVYVCYDSCLSIDMSNPTH